MFLQTSELTPDDAIASVLGKTTRTPRDIVAALDRTFVVSTDPVTRKSEVTFVPAGNSGSVSSGRPRPLRGSRASLFERANAVIQVMRPIVIRIEAARSDGDCSDVEAIRSLIPPTLDAIADALGSSEPPVNGIVDALLVSLANQTAQFGKLLGISSAINTACDETRATDFKILSESQQTLKKIWSDWTPGSADLGVTMADVEAEMNEIADATDELRDALLAAGIVPADWPSVNVADHVNLAQFFDCIGSTPGRAQLAVREGGRYGLTLSVGPMLQALEPLVKTGLITKDGGCSQATPEIDTAFCRIRTAISDAIHAITNLPGGQS